MIIKEEQNAVDWLIKRRSQIRATDFALLYQDVLTPNHRRKTTAIEKLIQEKVYGETQEFFNSDYANQGHVREPAILARMSAYLGVELQNDITAYSNENSYLASSLDGYAININVECKTMTINTNNFAKNLINNCKKWRYQVMHQIYCSGVKKSYVAIEFQHYFGVGEGFCHESRDFIAIDFMTGDIVISDFQHWKHEEDLIKATIKEYLFFDKECTKDVWLSVCNEALTAIVDEKMKRCDTL